MPELPEVETVRRHLEAVLCGRTLARVWLSGQRLRRPVPRALAAEAAGHAVRSVGRHGKFLLLDFTGGGRIVAHLGMTGKFLFHEREPARRPPHTHAVFTFEDGAVLLFLDVRRFGLLDWVGPGASDDGLGPPGQGLDPTRERLDSEVLARLFRRCRGPVKHLLLDQRRIAGIGNIYACEALFRARIGPRRLVHTLDRIERGRLAEEIHAVLEQAIRHRGTTISDFRDLDDRPGGYATALLVYDREGEPCRVCGSAIRRIVQAGRATYWCSTCQRKPPRGAVSLSRPGRAPRAAP